MAYRLVFNLFLAMALLNFVHGKSMPLKHAISLSPKTWLIGEQQRYETLSLRQHNSRPKPLAFSNGKGLVAGTDSPLAIHAGLHALRRGGSAMDACLTTALTDITLSAGSHLSYAGVANILYYDSSDGQTYNLDAGWANPLHIDPIHVSSSRTKRKNGASVLVPGFIAGVSEAADRYGKFPLSSLLEPALYFAEKGFKVPDELAATIKSKYNRDTLLRTREGKITFTNRKTWKPYKAGDLFKQRKLAKFLHWLSRQGKDYMYRGHWAEEMTHVVQKNLGYITMRDLRKYQARWLEPGKTTYSGHHVVTTGADWGGAELVEGLNFLEMAGVGQSKGSYLTNATEFYWLASIARLSHSISTYLHAVPKAREALFELFGSEFLAGDRLTKSSAHALWQKIDTPEKMKAMSDVMEKLLASQQESTQRSREKAGGVVAVDIDGNVCSMMHTANSDPWGTGLFVKGVALPHSAITLKSYVKQTRQGERLPCGLQPLIVFKASSSSYGDPIKMSLKGNFVKSDRLNPSMEFGNVEMSEPMEQVPDRPFHSEEVDNGLMTIGWFPFLEEEEKRPEEELEETEGNQPHNTGLKPVLALAMNGHSSHEVVLQYLANTLSRSLDPKAAVESPIFFLPSSRASHLEVEENAFDPNLIRDLQKLGQPVREVGYGKIKSEAGAGAVLTIDSTYKMYGCTSPLASGLAVGGSFVVDEE